MPNFPQGLTLNIIISIIAIGCKTSLLNDWKRHRTAEMDLVSGRKEASFA